ncbi:MAG: NrfD/PsrC family molybdoenzyme membrane anchor subunit [bacterium]
MNRVRNFKLILWSVLGLGAAVATARFMFGLGATTNLSDAVPWGIWIGFDVMSGVALAAGGFVLTATVYIFKLEKFHAIVRPAVLTAFLGYIAVAVGLLFDLGLPWNIWHMIVFWNPHSPLFEVGWCVMLYLTVLLLEFFPIPAEEFRPLAKIRNFLVRLRLPLVIAGIALSTLHQSSLGSLFLIMPYNVHPLWYSPLLPINFFVSAIALGILMVTFEGLFTSYLYRREPESGLFERLVRAARWVLSGYLILRFTDLAIRGKLGLAFGGEWQVRMFWFEIAVSALLPILLLSIPVIRKITAWQWGISLCGIFGVVLNRINVGGLVHINRGETLYLPSWTEITISAAVVSGAALVFLYMVEKFKVWEERPSDPEAAPHVIPEFDYASDATLGAPAIAARTKYSLAFVIAVAVGMALLSPHSLSNQGVESAPVSEARGWDTLWVDGDLNGLGVEFAHDQHIFKNGGEQSCVLCHHMNLPLDKASGCYSCHRDMYQLTDAFGHDWHASPSGAKLRCFDCHQTGFVKSASSAKECSYCHPELVPAEASIEIDGYVAVSYIDAMHQLCIKCHAAKSFELEKPNLARCTACHRGSRKILASEELDVRYRQTRGKANATIPSLELYPAVKTDHP